MMQAGTPAGLPYFYIFDLIGVAVFAISGALAAGRQRLDLVGVIVAAAATAIGGGTIRDVLIDRHPIFWLSDGRYLLVIVASALATILYARHRRVSWIALEVADAAGLALFSVSGAHVAELAGMPPVSCVVLGAVTGTAGGVIRDVLLAHVPHILQRRSLYATAAIAGATLYMVMVRMGSAFLPATLAGAACVFAVRVAAIWWGLKLPRFEVRTDEHPVHPLRNEKVRAPE